MPQASGYSIACITCCHADLFTLEMCAGSASTAQDLVSSLTPDEVAALPSVPEGLQIILLPANLSLAGLPASMAIPASFTVPQQLQSYSYILTAASDALPALPAGFNASSPSPGKLLCLQQPLAQTPALRHAGTTLGHSSALDRPCKY